MSSVYQIRKAGIPDLAQIIQIEARVFPDPWTKAQLAFELKEQPTAFNRVVVYQGNVVGYLMSHVIYDVVHLNNLAVDLPVQGKGVGRLLMESLFKSLADRQPVKIFLEVAETNCQAIRFYQKFGFETINSRKKYYHSGEDALVMVCKLETYGLVQA